MTTLAAAFAIRRVALAELATAGKRSLATLDFFDSKSKPLLAGLGRRSDPALLTAARVDEYISSRRATVGEHTIQKELAVLRGVLSLALRRGLWSGSLKATLPDGFSPRYEPKTRWLSGPELDALIFHLRTPDARARVAFMVATSAEWGATDRALRQDCGVGIVRVRGTKRPQRDREVPIVTPWQKRLMGVVLTNASGVAPLLFRPWSNARRDIRRACDAAGIVACSPNDLRRTFATQLHADGVRLEHIAPAMGHADTTMLQRIYARLDSTQLGARIAAELKP